MHPGRADVIGAGALILSTGCCARTARRHLRRLRGRHPRRDRLVASPRSVLSRADRARDRHAADSRGTHEADDHDRTSPIGALVHRLSEQIPELVRSEMRLAQAELTEKGKKAGLGIGLFSAAGLLAFLGLATLITDGDPARSRSVLPAWASALIVAVVLLAGAAVAGADRQEGGRAGDPARARSGRSPGSSEDVAAVKGGHRMSTEPRANGLDRRAAARPTSRASARSSPPRWTRSRPARRQGPRHGQGRRACATGPPPTTGRPRPEVARRVPLAVVARSWRSSSCAAAPADPREEGAHP